MNISRSYVRILEENASTGTLNPSVAGTIQSLVTVISKDEDYADLSMTQRGIEFFTTWGAEEDKTLAWYLQNHIERDPFSAAKTHEAQELLESLTSRLLRDTGPLGSILSHKPLSDGGRRVIHVDIEGSAKWLQAIPWEVLESRRMAQEYPWAQMFVRRVLQRSTPPAEQLEEGPQEWESTKTSVPPGLNCSQGRINILLLVSRTKGREDVGYLNVSKPLVDIIKRHPTEVAHVDVVRPGTLTAFDQALDIAKRRYGRGYYTIVHVDLHGVMKRDGTYLKFRSTKFMPDERDIKNNNKAWRETLVPASVFASKIHDHGSKLVFLNACGSAKMVGSRGSNLASAILGQGVSAVIGMSFKFQAEAVKIFMEPFYRKLFEGGDILESVFAGRQALRDSPLRTAKFAIRVEADDYLVPVLFEDPLKGSDLSLRLANETGALARRAEDLHIGNALAIAPLKPSGTLVREELFLGRDFDILEIEEKLFLNPFSDVTLPAILVKGFMGIGKATLARQLTAWWLDTHLFEAGFICDAKDVGGQCPMASFKTVLAEIGRVMVNEPSPELKRSVQHISLKAAHYDSNATDIDTYYKLAIDFLKQERVILAVLNLDPNRGSEMAGWAGDLVKCLHELPKAQTKSLLLMTSAWELKTLGLASTKPIMTHCLEGLDNAALTQYARHILGGELDRFISHQRSRNCLELLFDLFQGHLGAIKAVLKKLSEVGIPVPDFLDSIFRNREETTPNVDGEDCVSLCTLYFSVAMLEVREEEPHCTAILTILPWMYDTVSLDILRLLMRGMSTVDQGFGPLMLALLGLDSSAGALSHTLLEDPDNIPSQLWAAAKEPTAEQFNGALGILERWGVLERIRRGFAGAEDVRLHPMLGRFEPFGQLGASVSEFGLPVVALSTTLASAVDIELSADGIDFAPTNKALVRSLWWNIVYCLRETVDGPNMWITPASSFDTLFLAAQGLALGSGVSLALSEQLASIAEVGVETIKKHFELHPGWSDRWWTGALLVQGPGRSQLNLTMGYGYTHAMSKTRTDNEHGMKPAVFARLVSLLRVMVKVAQRDFPERAFVINEAIIGLFERRLYSGWPHDKKLDRWEIDAVIKRAELAVECGKWMDEAASALLIHFGVFTNDLNDFLLQSLNARIDRAALKFLGFELDPSKVVCVDESFRPELQPHAQVHASGYDLEEAKAQWFLQNIQHTDGSSQCRRFKLVEAAKAYFLGRLEQAIVVGNLKERIRVQEYLFQVTFLTKDYEGAISHLDAISSLVAANTEEFNKMLSNSQEYMAQHHHRYAICCRATEAPQVEVENHVATIFSIKDEQWKSCIDEIHRKLLIPALRSWYLTGRRALNGYIHPDQNRLSEVVPRLGEESKSFVEGCGVLFDPIRHGMEGDVEPESSLTGHRPFDDNDEAARGARDLTQKLYYNILIQEGKQQI